MTNLIHRLRQGEAYEPYTGQRIKCDCVMDEAADRIEQLELENAELRKNQTYLDFYTKNNSKFTVVGGTWYYRTGYGMPHKKTRSLIDAIEFAMKQEQS